MKRCPQCAEKIQRGALLCRFCGHRFAQEEAEAEQTDRSARRWALAVAAVLGVVGMCSLGGREKAAPDPVARAACETELARWIESGVAVRREDRDTLLVNETAWRALPVERQRALMLALACSAGDGVAGDTYVALRAPGTVDILASGVPGLGRFDIR